MNSVEKKKYFYDMVGGMITNGNSVNMVYLLHVRATLL